MRLIFLILFATLAVFVDSDKIRYDGHTVYRITPKTKSQEDVLSKLDKSRMYNFWTEMNNNGLPVDIMVKPQDQDAFKNEISKNGMHPDVFIEDVQKLIDDEIIAKFDGNMTWTAYYQIADIYTWMTQLILEHPNKVSVVSIGTTYEGRQIKGLVVSFKQGQRAIVIEGGTHAREWISPATVTYIANEVLTNKDPAFRKVVESFEWHFFPSVNPDGYAYSQSTDRLWRKSRSRYGECFGVDHNRNWDMEWMVHGSSSEPCSETYAGKAPFSEMETLAVSKYIASVAYKMDAYISFHSYYQLLMLPFGNTTEPLANYDEMKQICTKGAEALAEKHGTVYKVGNIAEIIYKATGASVDWVKDKFKTPIVYEYELRDRGLFGFLLPPSQIIPNGEEVMDSIIAILLEAENFGYVSIDK